MMQEILGNLLLRASDSPGNLEAQQPIRTAAGETKSLAAIEIGSLGA